MKTTNSKEFLKTKGLKDTIFDVQKGEGWIDGGLSQLLDEYLTELGYDVADINNITKDSYDKIQDDIYIANLIEDVNRNRGKEYSIGLKLNSVKIDKDNGLLVEPIQPQCKFNDDIVSGIGGIKITNRKEIIIFLENYLKR